MNINEILFSFLFNNLSNLENYLDYENKLNLNIRTNYNKLIFLGNKRTFDTNTIKSKKIELIFKKIFFFNFIFILITKF